MEVEANKHKRNPQRKGLNVTEARISICFKIPLYHDGEYGLVQNHNMRPYSDVHIISAPISPSHFSCQLPQITSQNLGHPMSDNTKLFSPTTRDQESLKDILPASFRDDDLLFAPLNDIAKFLELDLSVKRLNVIQEHLWLAGRPMPPRPLNYQVSVSRQIIVDEKVDMHLVWGPARRIHIKPLPQYLLDSRFWSAHLVCNGNECYRGLGTNSDADAASTHQPEQAKEASTKDCPHSNLSKLAMGFLSSYIALIQHPSDFLIAKEYNLLPESLTWPQWSTLVQNLLENDITNPDKLNRRYEYGELRLSRLNKIYIFQRGSFLRGYRAKYQTYQELFHAYLTPITAMTVYIALVLTAMQVGLGTEKLQTSQAFQNASYGFTVFSILGPLLLVFLVVVVAIAHLGANSFATIILQKQKPGLSRKISRRA
jgi:hypothetical protein